MKSFFFIVLVMYTSGSWASADYAPSKQLVIRNVTLIDTGGAKKDVLASLLIINYKLAIVTTDTLPLNDQMQIIDAKNGFLIGQLTLGEHVTFMVFDEDPRKKSYVMLDTKTYAQLSVFNSVVIANKYAEQKVADIPEQERKVKRGWLAYSPPPLSLATNYLDTRKWNRWESKYIDGLFLAAVLMDRQHWINQDLNSEFQVGELNDYNQGEIRAYRLGAIGTLNFEKPWVYTLFGANNAFSKGFDDDRDEDFTWLDYRLDIPLPANTTLSIGKQKEPISMERIMSMVYLPMQERTSVSDGFLPSRNVGFTYSGMLLQQNMTWAAGLFNNGVDNGESVSDSANQLIGRVTGVAYESKDKNSLWHLGAGYRLSDAKKGFQYFTEPEFNSSPRFVDTGLHAAAKIETLQLESSYRSGPLWLHGEYMVSQVDADVLNNPAFGGYHLTASWVLSGESRRYNRRNGTFGPVPIAQSVYNGGWGAWETAIRWSDIDLTDEGIDGGEMDILSLALNWWLSPIFNVNVNARHIWLDQGGVNGESNGINARLLLILE
ncbi:MAG: hypothetical protein HRU20_12275 [Pseudomonadales bacterium]|nr:hypothetical protein [Pseudomonadales bacterium]